jgi:OmpA-OmpF porin, OOP family
MRPPLAEARIRPLPPRRPHRRPLPRRPRLPPPATVSPGQGAWANYDFKPGDRVLLVEDFANDEVGDFPRRMEFKSGALEVVDWQGTRYLRATDDSKFYLVLPELLPDRFTMEFDYSIPSGGEVWISLDGKDGPQRLVTFGGPATAGVRNTTTDITARGQLPDASLDKIRRARVMGDGKYLKVYLDDTRLLNVPNADLGRANKILFFTDGNATKPTLFGNFRVAAGGKKLYDALTEKGRVAHPGHLLRYRQRPAAARVDPDAQGNRDHAEGSRRSEAHHRGPHR